MAFHRRIMPGIDVKQPQVCKAPGGVLPHMGWIGMRGLKGYGSSAVLVINRVSNLAYSGHK